MIQGALYCSMPVVCYWMYCSMPVVCYWMYCSILYLLYAPSRRNTRLALSLTADTPERSLKSMAPRTSSGHSPWAVRSSRVALLKAASAPACMPAIPDIPPTAPSTYLTLK